MVAHETQLPPAAESLIARFGERRARVGVIGLGYVGLPLAVVLAEAGYTVMGVDLDAAKVEALHRGESYIEDIPAATVAGLVQAGRLEASTEFSRLSEVDG